MLKLFEFLRVCLSVTRLVYIRVGCFFWGLTAPDQVPWHTEKKTETPTYGGVWWRTAVTQSGFRKHENAISLPVSQWWRLTGMMNGRDDGE